MQTFDRFEIRLNLASFGYGEICVVAKIYINDRSLIDMVRERDYSYLPARMVLLPSRSLLDEPNDDLQGGKSIVLGCSCGWHDCSSLLVRIALTDSTVEWSNFSHNSGGEYNLGTFRFDRDQYLAELSKEIALPTSDADFLNRGKAKYNLGDEQGAINDYDRAIELNPNNSDTYFKRGDAKSNLGDYQGAISDYARAIELNPNDADAYLNRGNAKCSLGDYQGAIADYDRAIELNPNDADAYLNRGIAKYKLEDYQGTITDCDRASELNSRDDIGAYLCRIDDLSFYKVFARHKLRDR